MSASPLPAPTPSTDANLPARHRRGRVWRIAFMASTIFGVLALVVLLVNITNNALGLAAVEYKKPPEGLTAEGMPLDTLSSEQLITVLQENLTKNRLKTLEKEKPLSELSQEELVVMVYDTVVQPDVVASWGLFESILRAEAIQAEAAAEYPDARLEFMNWLDRQFLTSPQASQALYAGVRTAIMGSLYVILITTLVAFPIGIGASIYLQEYAANTRLNRLIQININNLAGVPSIIYGMLGLTIFVRLAAQLTSGAIFGYPDADPNNGRTILSAGLTMSLLILPVIIINAQEAIKAVPGSLRDASYGLGATRWQTVWSHVLPNAFAGILTGTILAVSRAFGETAPLIIVGAATYVTFDPDGIFSKFTTLPIQIYQWTSRPQDEFRNIAAAAILALLAILLAVNAVAIVLRNHFSRRLQ